MNMQIGWRALRSVVFISVALLQAYPSPCLAQERLKLTPDLRSGETLRYDIRGRIARHVKTESHVGIITVPGEVKAEFSGILLVTVKAARTEGARPVLDLETEFDYPVSATDAKRDVAKAPPEKHRIDFTIGANGQLMRETGLDDMDPMERIAWQFWISQFAFGWTVAAENAKQGEKWKSEAPENNPVPIGRLVWERETTYGETGNCPETSAETCTIFYTSAMLKQKSSPQDATPEDYKLHELKTSGTATGSNDIYTSISQATGLAMRGTEDLKQAMNVVIAKADASNAVKYTVDATSHFEMVKVVEGVAAAR